MLDLAFALLTEHMNTRERGVYRRWLHGEISDGEIAAAMRPAFVADPSAPREPAGSDLAALEERQNRLLALVGADGGIVEDDEEGATS